MRIFEKIQGMLLGIISKNNMTYLFWLHLISGIGQSVSGGLTSKEFAESIEFEKYKNWIKNFNAIEKNFWKNEKASILGKVRINIFVLLMKQKRYRLAGKVMGLK
jgi:hypothetical protein